MGWESLLAGGDRDRGLSVAGAECHWPVHMLGGVELGSSGQSQVLCELRERQRPEETGIWHKKRCSPHPHRLKSAAAAFWDLRFLLPFGRHVTLHAS